MTTRDAALTVAVAATWGVCFVLLGTLTLAGDPLLLAAGRALLGGAVLAGVALWRGGPRRLFAAGAGWRVVGLLALLNGATALGAMFLAAGRTDAAAATVVGNSQPILLAVAGAALFGERVGRRGAFGITLGAAGVLLVAASSRDGGADVGGLALALLSSAAPAGGTILMRRLVGRVDLLVVTAWQFLAGGVVLLVASALLEDPSAVRLGGADVLTLLFLGVVGTGIAYLVWFGLLSRVPLAHLGSALYLVPVAGVAADILAGGRVDPAELVGLAVMLAGVALAAWRPATGGGAVATRATGGAARTTEPSSAPLSRASGTSHSPAAG